MFKKKLLRNTVNFQLMESACICAPPFIIQTVPRHHESECISGGKTSQVFFNDLSLFSLSLFFFFWFLVCFVCFNGKLFLSLLCERLHCQVGASEMLQKECVLAQPRTRYSQIHFPRKQESLGLQVLN